MCGRASRDMFCSNGVADVSNGSGRDAFAEAVSMTRYESSRRIDCSVMQGKKRPPTRLHSSAAPILTCVHAMLYTRDVRHSDSDLQ